MSNYYFNSVSKFIDLLMNRSLNYSNNCATDPPLVSVISPFFNDSKYFKAAYQSVIEQTWQNFEWIIVNDCSTEPESIALFNSLNRLNSKIKTLNLPQNQGPSAARNIAVSQAKGKYLFFMDTDDLIAPTYIEKCVLFLETHPDFSLVNSYSVGFQEEEYWWTFGFDRPEKFIEQNWVTGRLLYRKEDFLKLGGYNEELRVYEDWERWLKAICNGQKAWTIPEFLDCYRRTDSGLLSHGRKDRPKNEHIIKLIQAKYQQFFEDNLVTKIEQSRPSFNATILQTKLPLENPLHDLNPGKRILCWFPHLVVGGADKFNLDLVTALQQKDYDITIATTLPSQHTWHERFYRLTPDIFHLPGLIPDAYWLSFARYIIESRQIDVVLISNSYYAYYLLPFLRAEFPQVAFIDYTHTDDPGWRGGGYPRVSCQFSDFLDLQIVSSQNLANYYRQLQPETKDKLRVCYTNEDPQQWQPDDYLRKQIRANLGIEEDTVLLIFPARITAQKRPLLFVDIMARLVSNSLPVVALMLGTGELVSPVKAKIDKLGLISRFYLLPAVTPEEMIGFYSAADILLLPSEYEGLSLAIYEAMSMELPIVASDVGGHQELVTPDCGYLLTKGVADGEEIDRYVEVLKPLIENRNLRTRLGKAARKRIVRHFQLTAMIETMETLFTEAINLRKTSPPIQFNRAIAEEMLIWLQENVALDYLWQDLQAKNRDLTAKEQEITRLQQEKNISIAQNRAWRQVMQEETTKLNQKNELLRHQNQAWIKVAQQAQMELIEARKIIEKFDLKLDRNRSLMEARQERIGKRNKGE
jgi:glycosyltransferase involved in cell wall biosynthesis